jgi:hypothetical protein
MPETTTQSTPTPRPYTRPSPNPANETLRQELFFAGVRDGHTQQAYHSAVTAVALGMNPRVATDYLLKNRGDLFDERLAIDRRSRQGESACENIKRRSRYVVT